MSDKKAQMEEPNWKPETVMSSERKKRLLRCIDCLGFPCDYLVLDNMTFKQAWDICKNTED